MHNRHNKDTRHRWNMEKTTYKVEKTTNKSRTQHKQYRKPHNIYIEDHIQKSWQQLEKQIKPYEYA